MLLDDMTPAQRYAYHLRAYRPVIRDLEELIGSNIRLARMHRAPHMRRFYVLTARLQGRWLLAKHRALREMAAAAGETYAGRSRIVVPPMRLTTSPTAIVLPGSSSRRCPEPPRRAPAPIPIGPATQASLFDL